VPTSEDIELMAVSLRADDQQEIRALTSRPFEEVVRESVERSRRTRAGLYNGELVCMYGVIEDNMLSGTGAPWMLSTDNIEKCPTRFLKESKRQALPMIKEGYRHLRQIVDVRNKVAIHWLKWLGFEFGDPIHMGLRGEPFYLFEMRIR